MKQVQLKENSDSSMSLEFCACVKRRNFDFVDSKPTECLYISEHSHLSDDQIFLDLILKYIEFYNQRILEHDKVKQLVLVQVLFNSMKCGLCEVLDYHNKT